MKLLTELDSLDNMKDGETRKLITKATSSGSGNVVSSVGISGDTITYTKGVTALTAHQNAFSKVKVGSTDVAADSAGDTLELVAGSNVTLTPDATNDKVTIAATDTTYESKAAASGGTAVSLVTTGEKYTWNNKQNALTTQTAYSAKGTATKVPQITTNTLGQVTKIEEVTITQPTVNNGTLTIQKNGTNVQTFTANQSSNVTANITVPTKTSDLTNDSNFLVNSSSYLNIHPENGPVVIPFINNDIAFLKTRGGSYIVEYDGVTQSQDIDSVFNGSPNYWAINPTGITEITITLTLHKTFTWSNWIYCDFGSSGWRSKNIKIEIMNSNYAQDVWVTKLNRTGNTQGNIAISVSHTPVGADNAGGGFNKIRFTFSSWNSSTIFRIAQLGIYNYGSLGVRETFMSRGTDDSVYRNITPNTTDTYNLGSSSKKWNNIYAKSCNATSFKGALGGNGRITSADVAHDYTDSIVHQRLDIASSSMTTNKPASDGFIQTFLWDNSGSYNSQLFIPNGASTRLQARFKENQTNWSAWKDIPYMSDIPTKVSQLTNDSGYTSNTGTITGVSVNGTSVATSGTANITSIPASILTGAIPSAVTATTQSQGNNSTKIATTAYVDTAITNLPEPMIFKGSLGTGGTITSLPTPSVSNEGYTYKVITAGTYASQSAKIGDTFISDGSAWVLIPSGDEPSGTVTSITLKATSPIAIDSTSAITTSGTRTLSHANSGVTAGTYKSVTVNATGHVTAGTNPTTLSGYGITDAKIDGGVITLGSNTITPLTSHQDISGKVNKSGDTMSGNLTIQKASPKLVLKASDTSDVAINIGNSNYTRDAIVASNASVNGYNLAIDSGGRTILGSGEAGANLHSTLGKNVDAETLYLISDNQIWFDSNAQTIGNRVGFQLDNSGNIVPTVADTATTNKGGVGTSTYKWANGYFTNINGVAVGDSPKFTDNDTKNTAGSTDTSSKIYLIGATSQAANPQTYSDNEVFTTSGVLQAKSYSVNGGATIEFNSTDKCIEFNFV